MSNNVGAEAYATEDIVIEDGEHFETMEEVNTQEEVVDTFEESGGELEEDEDIPLVSGKVFLSFFFFFFSFSN